MQILIEIVGKDTLKTIIIMAAGVAITKLSNIKNVEISLPGGLIKGRWD